MCVYVCVFFALTDRASTIPSNILYGVANPVRGLLDSEKSEEHIQSSNESIKKKRQKRQQKGKKKNTHKQMPEKDTINSIGITRVQRRAANQPIKYKTDAWRYR